MTNIAEIESYVRKNAFNWYCTSGKRAPVIEMLEQNIPRDIIIEGLFSACDYVNYEIIQVLLPYVDQISIRCLSAASNNRNYIYNDPWINQRVAIIKLLLEHTKFDTTDALFTDRTVLLPEEIRSLLDQHMFAIDGPEYNKNIL
jgi:hypothetical protein